MRRDRPPRGGRQGDALPPLPHQGVARVGGDGGRGLAGHISIPRRCGLHIGRSVKINCNHKPLRQTADIQAEPLNPAKPTLS
jgi:hypothetical protein